MKPLNLTLKKYIRGYKLIKSKEKTNHIMYMDDIKIRYPDTGSDNIQLGHRDGI